MKFLDWVIGAIIWKEMADTVFDKKPEPRTDAHTTLMDENNDDWSDDIYD